MPNGLRKVHPYLTFIYIPSRHHLNVLGPITTDILMNHAHGVLTQITTVVNTLNQGTATIPDPDDANLYHFHSALVSVLQARPESRAAPFPDETPISGFLDSKPKPD
ncbi:MAG: hypothetical protein ABW166_02100 [Sedimenticola sp.]